MINKTKDCPSNTTKAFNRIFKFPCLVCKEEEKKFKAIKWFISQGMFIVDEFYRNLENPFYRRK